MPGTLCPPSCDKRNHKYCWDKYKQERPDHEQIASWFQDGSRTGLGLVCGEVSGHLEMFEFEGRAVADQGSGVFRNCPFCRACEQWAEIALLMGAGTPRDHVGL
jgi:putative DNA primase/helicase